MKAEIITVGTELLIGDTVDTHSSFLSRHCLHIGISVHCHTSIGDDQKRMLELFHIATTRSDLVIICGGLGPTMDDKTKETLGQYLGIELVSDLEVTKHLERYFYERYHEKIPSNNYKQTYVFPQGIVFPNDHGTAPGLAISKNQTTYVLLPGPPKELVPMFEKYVRPFLIGLLPAKQIILHDDLSFFGIGESLLEDKISDLVEHSLNPSVATYIYKSSVIVRITGRGSDRSKVQQQIDKCKKKILNRVGEYCYSEQKEKIEEVVVRMLCNQNRTVAFAESCTGGLLAHYISTVPGCSSVFHGGLVSYTNQAKEKLKLVSSSALKTNGSVHWMTAKAMAENVFMQFDTDFALSITGVAGPSSVEEKPVGIVYIGLSERGEPTRIYQLKFRGSRQTIQQSAARHALFILQQRLKKGEVTS